MTKAHVTLGLLFLSVASFPVSPAADPFLSGLPKDVINEVVVRHRSEIRDCYVVALRRNPSLRAKVVVAFNIAPSGVVQSASVKERTPGEGALGNCIVSRVKSWVFPESKAQVETEVSAYPFYLNPAN